jgi:hypothetical protein
MFLLLLLLLMMMMMMMPKEIEGVTIRILSCMDYMTTY